MEHESMTSTDALCAAWDLMEPVDIQDLTERTFHGIYRAKPYRRSRLRSCRP